MSSWIEVLSTYTLWCAGVSVSNLRTYSNTSGDLRALQQGNTALQATGFACRNAPISSPQSGQKYRKLARRGRDDVLVAYEEQLTLSSAMAITTAENDIKERMSLAYVTAVAARVGCELSEVKVDRSGIDATIRAIKGTPVKIDIQMKATSSLNLDRETLKFDLDVAGYDHLRSTVIQAPQLLIVLLLPEDGENWLIADEETLAFKKCAYWHNLHGMPETENASTIRVSLPREQMFHPDALRDLMQRAHDKAVQGLTGL